MNKLILLDLDFVLYLCTYNKKDEPTKTFEDCCNHADNMINSIFIATGAEEYISAFTIGRCFRYDVFPAYKANRPKEKNNFFYELRDYLSEKYKVYHDPYLESDDIISILKGIYPEALVVAEDKDLRMLEGKWYNPKKNEFGETNKSQACRFFWSSMILGDDGFKGLLGKGPKFVDKVFHFVDKVLTEDQLNIGYRDSVLDSYIDHYKDEAEGIEQFYIGYKVLKLLTKPYKGMVLPTPIPVPKVEIPQLPSIEELDMKIELNDLNNDLNFLL